MSVAFRRESDEEHLEPKFDLPIPPGPNFVTANGLVQTRLKVAELEALLPQLTEEADIAAARRQLRYWRMRQATAQVAPVPNGTHVAFGCTVEFRLNGRNQTITIVGYDEADPASGVLAFSAPLCRAMIDAEVGDVVEFSGVPDAIEVLAIRAARG